MKLTSNNKRLFIIRRFKSKQAYFVAHQSTDQLRVKILLFFVNLTKKFYNDADFKSDIMILYMVFLHENVKH